MGAHGRPYQRIILPPVDEGLDLGEKLGLHIEDHARDKRPQPHLLCRRSSRIREIVHIIITGDAESDQLQAAELHPPVDILLSQPRLQGPDLLLQPGHQLHVVGIAPQEAHCQVGMAVDQAGDGQHSIALYHLIAALSGQAGADLGDLALLDSDILPWQKAAGLKDGYILYEHWRKICLADKKDCRPEDTAGAS